MWYVWKDTGWKLGRRPDDTVSLLDSRERCRSLDMSDRDQRDEEKQEELKRIEESLKNGGMSRRKFLDRMKAVGVGFGAAFLLGIKDANALAPPDGGVNVTSTNPAVDEILAESQEEQAAAADAEGPDALSGQRRYRRGYYRRWYRRYARWYRRYGRYYRRRYRRYGRYYGRRYARW
jgi:hypothetical protein